MHLKNLGLASLMFSLSLQSIAQVRHQNVPEAQRPVNLVDAVTTALRNNPRTTANNLRLQSLLDQVEAQKKSQLPRAYISHYEAFDRNRPQTTASSLDRTRQSVVGFTINLFNNFADTYRLQAAQCKHDQLKAEYNSTDTRILNTQGLLAGRVVESYIELAAIQESMDFSTQMIRIVDRIASVATTEEEQSRLRQFRDIFRINYQSLISEKGIAESQFQYLVTVPPPSRLEPFDDTINRILIPKDIGEAFNIALTKSPEIVTAQLRIRCSNLNLEVLKRSQGVRVDLDVYHSRSEVQARDYRATTNSTGAATTLNWSFGLADRSDVKAQVHEIDADTEDLKGAKADIENDLRKYYPTIENLTESIIAYKASQDAIERDVKIIMDRIDSNQPINVFSAIETLKSWDRTRLLLASNKELLLNSKFQIQKRIGILFDNLNLKVQ